MSANPNPMSCKLPTSGLFFLKWIENIVNDNFLCKLESVSHRLLAVILFACCYIIYYIINFKIVKLQGGFKRLLMTIISILFEI